MPNTEIDPAGLDAATAALPPGEPLFMINLLRFNEEADYGDAGFAPCSGREAYLTRYLPAFNEVVQSYGASELVFGGDVAARIVGPADDVWDSIGLVRYTSIEMFRGLIADPTYLKTAEPHRVAALADWRLYATSSFG
jgi:uncharacterized protein (DUF1330 family)